MNVYLELFNLKAKEIEKQLDKLSSDLAKSNLTKVSSEEIKKGRCKAYKYLI